YTPRAAATMSTYVLVARGELQPCAQASSGLLSGLRMRRHAVQRLITRPHRNASDSTPAPLAELLLRACGRDRDRPSAASAVRLAAQGETDADGTRMPEVPAKRLPATRTPFRVASSA